MSQTVEARAKPTPEEVERVTAEYRRAGYERPLPAVMVYAPEHQACPWPGCDVRIAAIDFQFHHWSDREFAERLRKEWWLGPGLVGRCPGCGRHVLFGFQFKRAVDDEAPFAEALLPADWVERVHLAPQRNTQGRGQG